MGLARAADLPVIVVGDIDRGGLLAHFFGTVAVLAPEDQALIAGFVVNKFRGDRSLLEPGLDQLLALAGRPTYGVLPFVEGLWLDTEDSLSVVANRMVGVPSAPRGSQTLTVAALRLPRISNSTDIEALACEPGVEVHWVSDAADLADADVIVIPGSKATVADLAWLRSRGLDAAIAAHAAAGRTVLGICGGFQMLCRRIVDQVESGQGEVAGLGLLDADIEFAPDKTLRHWDSPLSGYEIHHGQVSRSDAEDWLGVGLRSAAVFGSHWHGLLDNNDVRRDWLTEAATAARRDGFEVAADVDVPGRRDAQLDLMADVLSAHLDLDAVFALLEHGAPPRPIVTSALAGSLNR
jgi:adenosylcobyric acid synthase